jgi:hypothetical protein
VEQSPESISIVVIGAMNPRIHQPHWYSAAAIIHDDEMQAALQSLISVPRITQFAIDHVRITCQDDRWDLLAEGKESYSRGVDIAVSTWNKLHETPIISYGFNFFANYTLATINAGNLLSSLLPPRISELVVNPVGSEFKIIGIEPDLGQTTVDLRPSDQSDAAITASINYHFTPDDNAGYFDLGSALNEKFFLCLESAKTKLTSIQTLFKESEGKD